MNAPTNNESFFGLVPHQIRGQLGSFSTIQLTGERYEQCTACSKVISDLFEKQGTEFLVKALSTPEYLENVTGLTKLKQESENVEFEWSGSDTDI